MEINKCIRQFVCKYWDNMSVLVMVRNPSKFTVLREVLQNQNKVLVFVLILQLGKY
jgi:hypothetical protein